MKKNILYLVRGLVLAAIVSALVYTTNLILMHKDVFPDPYPATDTFYGFYSIKNNTVDVIFLGSSHGVSCFNSQFLYDDYGIPSYNLSSQQQSPLVSYFWLKEALKYQRPKVVIMDVHTAFPFNDNEPSNMDEPFVRAAIDPIWDPYLYLNKVNIPQY